MLDAGYGDCLGSRRVGGRIQWPASRIEHRAAPVSILFSNSHRAIVTLILIAAIPVVGAAQEIEPRTYSNTPVGLNFLAVGYSYSSGNIFMDPSLPIEDLDGRVNVALVRYIRTFNLFGAPAKFKAMLPWATGHWDGFLDGEFQTRDASGLADARFGLDVLLVGAPVLEPAEFAGYEQKSVVGLRFDLVVPTGQYDSSKLINLGSNRWAFHSEVGFSKTWGRWTLEGSVGAWFYSDNDDFYGGSQLSQDRFLVAKVNIVRSIRPGFWWAVGSGHGLRAGWAYLCRQCGSQHHPEKLAGHGDYGVPAGKEPGAERDPDLRQDLSGGAGFRRCRRCVSVRLVREKKPAHYFRS